jgi:hypothetical protein
MGRQENPLDPGAGPVHRSTSRTSSRPSAGATYPQPTSAARTPRSARSWPQSSLAVLNWCLCVRFSLPPVAYHVRAELTGHGLVGEYTEAGLQLAGSALGVDCPVRGGSRARRGD